MRLLIDHTWDGDAIDNNERASIEFALQGRALRVDVEAPFHGDPPPSSSPGRADRLWEHEVVELFLLGTHEQYLEIELGPHGHYLVLQLKGPRHVERMALLIEYKTEIGSGRWRGRALVPSTLLPHDVYRANAYAMYGTGSGRRYLAANPVPGEQPDFHRLDCFTPVKLN